MASCFQYLCGGYGRTKSASGLDKTNQKDFQSAYDVSQEHYQASLTDKLSNEKEAGWLFFGSLGYLMEERRTSCLEEAARIHVQLPSHCELQGIGAHLIRMG